MWNRYGTACCGKRVNLDEITGSLPRRFRTVVVYRLLGKVITGSFDEGPNGLRQRIAPVGLMNKPLAQKTGRVYCEDAPGWLAQFELAFRT